MSKKSKWFVVATEGATTDGRKISREWLTQMAANYDPKNTYGARINIEHIKFRMLWKDEPHSKAYGDVLALKTEERDDGKLQLLAQIEPTDDLIKLTQERQKIYTSIEIDLDFADKGQAYLVGLAVTDSPASLGTEMLQFCAGAKLNPLTERKQKADNLISEALEFSLQLEEIEEEKESVSLFSRVAELLTGKSKKDEARFADQTQAIELLSAHAAELTEKQTALETEQQTNLQNLTALQSAVSALQAQFKQLAAQPEAGYSEMPVATGTPNGDHSRFF
ncbi:Phage capsid scaffolding protein (GPO) serine peptidase [Pasteurella testudinis DSM 23072]|uniref:Phage capsid scaffolding protein (GPO) serine peptidase n=1 Tax=Pasteurella testudinis DSM 23072 TaxID=1122938 RepID=A0A1W1UMY4_9PAST|nr:GPO family capsid scaffolding protein [Pasteurella testudinis]SMB82456.1 Phage capsid scaffolding protein (GPO) serine peptidase [Pasteurella testudinis DSM 23072]SUB52201.1 Phage capsid scaffolding protein (GPO) serine peptidase [Pasteurella testudinis]